MSAFHPMPRRERAALIGLLVFSTVAFLPFVGKPTIFGVSLFGWFMTALLLGSPALLLFLVASDRSGAAPPPRKAGPKGKDRAA